MKTTLYYREGSSDKVYQAAIEAVEGGYHVTFAYGRRGSTLQTGTKTPVPVTKDEADRIAAKLVSAKISKGYTIAEEGTPYRSTGNEGRDSQVRCQLLNPVDESNLPSLLRDNRHVLQEKHDGKRLLVRKLGAEITGINRRGLIVSLPASIASAAEEIPVDFLLDGEAVGNTLHAFDLLELKGNDLRNRAYLDRFAGLLRILDVTSSIRPVATTVDPSDKEAQFRTLRQTGAEGVVFKDREAVFNSGRPSSGGSQLKFKFVSTASFLVAAVSDRRSVSLALFNDGNQVPAGNVSIPPDHDVPTPGQIVEVRFLYAFRQSGSVYQPVYLGPRDDIDPTECHTGQLKYKDEPVAA